MKKIKLTGFTLGEFTERESKAGKPYKAANCTIEYDGQVRNSLVFFQDYKRLERTKEGDEIYIVEENNGDYKNFKLVPEIEVVYDKLKTLYSMIQELEKRIKELENIKGLTGEPIHDVQTITTAGSEPTPTNTGLPDEEIIDDQLPF